MKKLILKVIIGIVAVFTVTFSTVYATDENSTNTNLPSSYDLRNDININVENQGQKGWCNAYATTKVIETYLQKTKGIDYNLSEAYMAYSEAEYFGGNNSYKKDINTVNYYSVDGNGKYVLENDIPNKDYSLTEVNREKFNNVIPVIKSVKDKTLKNSNEIKNYIINNGGVLLSICNDDKYYNTNTSAMYSPIDKRETVNWEQYNYETIQEKTYEIGSHAVVIIGWNDNYSKNNFNSNYKPKNDGAWLVLNSWGTQWGNNGTAWISYEDAYLNNCDILGVERILLKGELNVDFSYNINEQGIQSDGRGKITETSYRAIINTDDEIEDIEGWSEGKTRTFFGTTYTYTKIFTEEFEPYNIELRSKIDGTTKVIEINIPEKFKEEEKYKINKLAEIIKTALLFIIPILIFITTVIVIKKLISLPSKIHKKISKHKSNKK